MILSMYNVLYELLIFLSVTSADDFDGSLDPDQDGHYVRPDLDSTCLTL